MWHEIITLKHQSDGKLLSTGKGHYCIHHRYMNFKCIIFIGRLYILFHSIYTKIFLKRWNSKSKIMYWFLCRSWENKGAKIKETQDNVWSVPLQLLGAMLVQGFSRRLIAMRPYSTLMFAQFVELYTKNVFHKICLKRDYNVLVTFLLLWRGSTSKATLIKKDFNWELLAVIED